MKNWLVLRETRGGWGLELIEVFTCAADAAGYALLLTQITGSAHRALEVG